LFEDTSTTGDTLCSGVPSCSGDKQCYDPGAKVCGGQTTSADCPPPLTWCGGSGSGGGGGKCPQYDEPGDTYIEIINKATYPIWVWFNKDPTQNNHQFTPDFTYKKDTTWGTHICAGKSLYIHGPDRKWTGGQFAVTREKKVAGNGNINIAGLTSFEFTITTAKISGNISNVSGVNASGTMVVTGVTCDGKNTNTNADALLTSCPEQFKCDPNVCASGDACTLKKQKLLSKEIVPKTELKCGNNSKDCLGCPLDENTLTNCPPSTAWGDNNPMYKSACYGDILQHKYGCLEWWTDNTKAKAWKEYATRGSTDSYWWGMGEQKLGGDTYTGIAYKGGGLSLTPLQQACISGAQTGTSCAGNIIPVPKGESSLLSCTIGSWKPKITYTITGVMSHVSQ